MANRAHNLVRSGNKRDRGHNLRQATEDFGFHWRDEPLDARARRPREPPADYHRMLEARQDAHQAARQANLTQGRRRVGTQLRAMAGGGGKRARRNALYDLHGWPERPRLAEWPMDRVSQLKRPRTPDRDQQELDQSSLTHHGARAKRMGIALGGTPDTEMLGGPGEGQAEFPAANQGAWANRMDDDY